MSVAHDWHLIDAELDLHVRRNEDGTVDLGKPDGPQQHMTWEEFDKWREGTEDG